jgi:hypothetical protein
MVASGSPCYFIGRLGKFLQKSEGGAGSEDAEGSGQLGEDFLFCGCGSCRECVATRGSHKGILVF